MPRRERQDIPQKDSQTEPGNGAVSADQNDQSNVKDALSVIEVGGIEFPAFELPPRDVLAGLKVYFDNGRMPIAKPSEAVEQYTYRVKGVDYRDPSAVWKAVVEKFDGDITNYRRELASEIKVANAQAGVELKTVEDSPLGVDDPQGPRNVFNSKIRSAIVSYDGNYETSELQRVAQKMLNEGLKSGIQDYEFSLKRANALILLEELLRETPFGTFDSLRTKKAKEIIDDMSGFTVGDAMARDYLDKNKQFEGLYTTDVVLEKLKSFRQADGDKFTVADLADLREIEKMLLVLRADQLNDPLINEIHFALRMVGESLAESTINKSQEQADKLRVDGKAGQKPKGSRLGKILGRGKDETADKKDKAKSEPVSRKKAIKNDAISEKGGVDASNSNKESKGSAGSRKTAGRRPPTKKGKFGFINNAATVMAVGGLLVGGGYVVGDKYSDDSGDRTTHTRVVYGDYNDNRYGIQIIDSYNKESVGQDNFVEPSVTPVDDERTATPTIASSVTATPTTTATVAHQSTPMSPPSANGESTPVSPPSTSGTESATSTPKEDETITPTGTTEPNQTQTVTVTSTVTETATAVPTQDNSDTTPDTDANTDRERILVSGDQNQADAFSAVDSADGLLDGKLAIKIQEGETFRDALARTLGEVGITENGDIDSYLKFMNFREGKDLNSLTEGEEVVVDGQDLHSEAYIWRESDRNLTDELVDHYESRNTPIDRSVDIDWPSEYEEGSAELAEQIDEFNDGLAQTATTTVTPDVTFSVTVTPTPTQTPTSTSTPIVGTVTPVSSYTATPEVSLKEKRDHMLFIALAGDKIEKKFKNNLIVNSLIQDEEEDEEIVRV